MADFPRRGAFRILPERNLREEDPTANRIGLSQTEDRAPTQACPLLQGRLVDSWKSPSGDVTPEVIIPAGGSSSVPHGLQRKPAGWWVTRNRGTGYTSPVETSADDSYLVLKNPGPNELRVQLWVF